ncbi:DUF285 domain-containing protein [Mycoplasma phocoeninasale]|uniref:DUF285 domain-containing protein n=1 Tax=Mycoplasma phocoeninasale TaxID=2726117 RepID=A0A858U529_9MOLU|nr:BspA family leucine-rich repeat surface protein [Mycoplasma phocoeninasale]QJG66527.1 DUF285 domain-containing protein [Mycoplasma phocoeninasale]
MKKKGAMRKKILRKIFMTSLCLIPIIPIYAGINFSKLANTNFNLSKENNIILNSNKITKESKIAKIKAKYKSLGYELILHKKGEYVNYYYGLVCTRIGFMYFKNPANRFEVPLVVLEPFDENVVSFYQSFSNNIVRQAISGDFVVSMENAFEGCVWFNEYIDHWEVSDVINMSCMFKNAIKFNEKLTTWNVKKVIDMSSMFEGATLFNGDITPWKTESAMTMSSMFKDAWNFDQSLYYWDTSNVRDMSSMFEGAKKFNNYVYSWDVSKVRNMSSMFKDAVSFNDSIGNWITSNVTTMSKMFEGAREFNRSLYYWNTSNVNNMSSMFKGAKKFNNYVYSWDVSNVTNMSSMFEEAEEFNDDVYLWNFSNVINMSSMFKNAKKFNKWRSFQDFNLRDTSHTFKNVRDMSSMFEGAVEFNRDISMWDISNVRNMSSMFKNAKKFNNYGRSPFDALKYENNIKNMSSMFEGAESFNLDISRWNTSNVENMTKMFKNAKIFDANLSNWKVDSVKNYDEFCDGTLITFEKYPKGLTKDINKLNIKNDKKHSKIPYFSEDNYYEIVEFVKNNNKHINWNDFKFRFSKFSKEWMKIVITPSDTGKWKYRGELNLTVEFKREIRNSIKNDYLGKLLDNQVNNLEEITKKFVLNQLSVDKINYQYEHQPNNKKIILNFNNNDDYEDCTFEIRYEIKRPLSELITSSSFDKVNNLDEENIKRVLKIKHSNLDFDHLDLVINDNKVIIKAKDSYRDYQGQKEISIEVKKQISELITSSSFDKVNNLDEANIKRVLKIKHPTLDFEHLELVISGNKVIIKAKNSHPDYQGQKEIAIAAKRPLSELITSPKFNKVAKIDVEEIKRVIREKYSEIDFAHLDIEISGNKVIIKARDSHPDYQGQKEISIEVKKQVSELITSSSFDKVNNLDEANIKRVLKIKHPTLDFEHLELVISGNKVIIKAKNSHPDYQGQKEIAIAAKRPLSELITSPKFNKVAKIDVEEIKRVIREKYSEIDFAHLDIEISGNKVIIKARDSHPDYQGQKEISIEVKKQVSELITSSSFDKVNNLDEANIKRVLKIKHPTLDFEHLELVISGNKVIIKAKNSHPDYQGQKEISIEVKKQISELITSSSFDKVNNLDEANIKRVLKTKHPTLDFEHLELVISGNKVIIKAKNSHPDYQGQKEISIEVKKQISELITSSSFDKVNNLDEANIKRVLKTKHPTLDFEHLELVISGNKVIIKAKNSHPDYQGQKEIAIAAKRPLSELITSPKFNKVAKIDVEEIKRVIREKYSEIDFAHLDIEISGNKVIIKARDSHPDYQGQKEISIEVKKQVSELITSSSFDKVNNLDEANIKRVLKTKHPTLDFEHLELVISGNKVIIKAKNSHPDYQGQKEIAIAAKRPLSELITSPKFNKVAKIDVEEIKRVIREKYSEIDFAHLDIEISGNKVIIKARDSHPDYQGQKEISIEVKKQVSELITSSSFDKVNNLDEANIKRVLKIKHPTLDFEHLELVISGNKVIIKAKNSHPDYQGQKEISIEVKKQVSELITSSSFDKVNNLDEANIKRVLKIKHPTLDFEHLELVISGNKVIIKAKNSHPDYQGQKEIAIAAKRPLSELITSSKFNKVAKIDVEEIKRVIREKYSEIDFAHLDIEISGNKVIIKARDSHPDYQGQKEISIEVKKQISELITSSSFDKVNNLDEANIKRVLKIKHPTLDFEHLELVISGNKVIIKAKNSHPDYQGQKEIAIAAKRPLSELITSSKFNKVAKIDVEEIKRVIREKYSEIDFAHLDIEISGNKVIIKARDSHPDYQGQKEISIEVKKQISELITSSSFDKVNNLDEANIKRVLKIKHPTLDFEHLELVISGNKVIIKAKNSHPDYQGQKEIAIAAKRPLSELITSSKFNKVAKIDVEEIKRVIREKYSEIDFAHLDIEISGNKVIIKARDSHPDYQGKKEISIEVKKQVSELITSSSFDKVNNLDEANIKRVLKIKHPTLDFEHLELVISGNKVIIKAKNSHPDYQGQKEISIEVKKQISELITSSSFDKVNNLDEANIKRVLKIKHPTLDFEHLELVISGNKVIIKAKDSHPDYQGEIEVAIEAKKHITQITKNVDMNLKLDKVGHKEINEEKIKILIRDIFYKLNIIDIEFKLHIDKKNSKVFVDFDNDNNYYGKLLFNYEFNNSITIKNKRIVKWIIITVAISLILFITLIVLVKNRKKLKIKNRQNK